MKIILAPMQGVLDYPMRELLTRVGGYDRCVTEFVRVINHCVPEKVFYRLCPELNQGGKTQSNVPVFVQLLGGNPFYMAASAAVLAKLDCPGVDINFGCPSKCVNRHDGGSVLLNHPDRIEEIVSAVRDKLPESITLSVKIRLGFENADTLLQIVDKIVTAGANELSIHARTRVDGYKPPAYWSHLASLPDYPNLTLYCNGEIWNPANALDAQKQSNVTHLMLARGALAQPNLANMIRNDTQQKMPWVDVLALLENFFLSSDCHTPKYVGNRTKVWLSYLQREYSEAKLLFKSLKKCHDIESIKSLFLTEQRDLQNRYSKESIEDLVFEE